MFFEHGYAAASIDAVIERIGGSKRNIYTTFGSKEGLFTALVSENAEQIFGPLLTAGPVRKGLEETLTDFATRLLNIFMSRSMIGVYRVVVSEASRLPDLSANFYRNGPDRGADWVADILKEAQGRGEIHVDDPKSAAQQFIGILRGNLYMEIVLGLRKPLDPEEIARAAVSAVDLFLNGVKARI
ncbi:TetR/AcrR family transcriptional regulator (plasmid) [Agrobacterium tumefaciens]|nr:TetR/AcrR family transcriptional regulator [Agrobacterium tumefaciens]